MIEDGVAPSYFIEGLLYNVPELKFGGTRQQNFKDVLYWLIISDRSKFSCANEQFYLFGTGPVTWRADKCEKFLKAVKLYWDAGL